MNENIYTRKIKFLVLLNFIFFVGLVFAEESMIDLKTINQYSKILGETRKISVILPKGYHANEKKYPVLYVLDGDQHLLTVAGIVESLNYGPEPVAPPLIIVAVHNVNRMRDFTFSHTTLLPNGDSAPEIYKKTGKAKYFLQYLEDELKPLVDKHYRVANPNILIGHSLGGLFTLEALSYDSEAFSGFIAIDSSTWFDFENTYNRIQKGYKKDFKTPKALFLAIANTPYTPGFGRSNFHIEQLRKIARTLEPLDKEVLHIKSQSFQEYNHHSVYAPAVYSGLKWLFDGYQVQFSDLDLSSEKIVKNFNRLNNRLNSQLKPDQSLLLWAIKKSKKWPQMNLPEKEITKSLQYFYPDK